MRFSKFIMSVLSGDASSVSSKRLFGGIGFLASTIVVLYCTVTKCQAPDILEFYIVCSVSLVGLDSVTGIWTKRGKIPPTTPPDNSEQK